MGYSAIVKTQYGAYVAIENIDMRFYTLKNVRNPEDVQDVATKQYVDTANRAFIYGQGKYLATGEISMGGRRLDNVGMPIENHQVISFMWIP